MTKYQMPGNKFNSLQDPMEKNYVTLPENLKKTWKSR